MFNINYEFIAKNRELLSRNEKNNFDKLLIINEAITRLNEVKFKYDILSTLARFNYAIYNNSNYICTDDTFYTKKECNNKKEDALKKALNVQKKFELYNAHNETKINKELKKMKNDINIHTSYECVIKEDESPFIVGEIYTLTTIDTLNNKDTFILNGRNDFAYFKDEFLTHFKHVKTLKYIQVNKELYHENLSRLPNDYKAFLYPEFKADKYFLVYSGDVVGGFCVNKSGILEGLFTLIKGIGERVFKEQIKKTFHVMDDNNHSISLFCAGDFLKEYYLSRGFKVDEVIKFDDKLASKHWNYKRFKRPHLYNMSKYVH